MISITYYCTPYSRGIVHTLHDCSALLLMELSRHIDPTPRHGAIMSGGNDIIWGFSTFASPTKTKVLFVFNRICANGVKILVLFKDPEVSPSSRMSSVSGTRGLQTKQTPCAADVTRGKWGAVVAIIVHYKHMALAKNTTVLREAMLLFFEAFEVRIAKCCKQR